MNLSTARSEKRAKEVGIRKAIGSRDKFTVNQFLGESFLFASLSFVLTIILVQLSLPFLIVFQINKWVFPGVIFFSGCWRRGLYF